MDIKKVAAYLKEHLCAIVAIIIGVIAIIRTF